MVFKSAAFELKKKKNIKKNKTDLIKIKFITAVHKVTQRTRKNHKVLCVTFSSLCIFVIQQLFPFFFLQSSYVRDYMLHIQRECSLINPADMLVAVDEKYIFRVQKFCRIFIVAGIFFRKVSFSRQRINLRFITR